MKETTKVRCGINMIYLSVLMMVMVSFFSMLAHLVSTKFYDVDGGDIFAILMLYSLPIYLALFQTKIVRVENNEMKIFYPFRVLTRTYEMNELEYFKYRKNTKYMKWQIYAKAKSLTIKFSKDDYWCLDFAGLHYEF